MRILTAIFLLFALFACSDEWKKKDEVTGDGLKRGTAYEILEGRGNYTVFLEAINRIGYRDLLDGKGLSTLFVPDDAAFNAYFAKHHISGLDAIHTDTLSQLIGQHILKFAYRKQELNNFQPQSGMEDLPGVNYRHPTVVAPPIREFYNTANRRMVKVYRNTRYLPVFSTNLFNSLGITPAYNFEYFYPGTPWNDDLKGIAAGNAQITSDEIQTDNGYIYTIDQVIEPLHSVYEAMENEEQYSTAKSMYDKFLTFTYDKTNSQKYAAAGDSLFSIGVYSSKNFPLSCLADEWTSNGVWETPQFSTAFNAFIPTNEAFEDFFTEYWRDPEIQREQYTSYETMDRLPIYYLLENHILINNPAFPDRVKQVLRNSWGYPYSFDPDADVISKEMCVNGAFYGISELQVPAIFNSVVRPVFQSPSYKIFAYALAKSGLMSELANQEAVFTLFIADDASMESNQYTFNDPGTALDNVQIKSSGVNMSTTDLANFIHSHLLSFKLTKEILQGPPTYYDTEKTGTKIKIGNNTIELSDGTKATVSLTYPGTDSWQVYEVDRPLAEALVYWLAMCETAYTATHPTYNYYAWFKANVKEGIIKGSTYFPGSQTQPLKPFAANKGVFFAPHNSWALSEQNDVPYYKGGTGGTTAQKETMSAWLAKHMLRMEDNPEMDLSAFQSGEGLVGQTFQTYSKDVTLKITEVTPCTDAQDPISKEVESTLGKFKLTIEVLTKDKPTHTAVVYGPHISAESIFFLIRNAEQRFVYSDETE